MKVAALLVGVLSFVSHSDAVFTSDVLRAIQRGFLPDGLDLANTVNCRADDGKRFDVPLVAIRSEDGSLRFMPQTPDYIRIPEALECANTNAVILESLVQFIPGVNLNYQKLSEDETGDLDFTDDDVKEDLRDFCAMFYDQTNDIDYSDFIVDDTIIAITNRSGLTGLTFTPDTLTPDNINTRGNRRNQLNFLFEALRCYPRFQFADLGPAFLPRFMISGNCTTRACSFPIEEGQTCRADTNEVARLPGLRYDCCWSVDEESRNDPTKAPTLEFKCGWRLVNLPILCDCDCACDMSA